MTTLAETLALERDKMRHEAEDASRWREVGRAVLYALAQRLSADALPTWSFTCTGDEILIAHTRGGAREQVGAWKVGEELRLVLGEVMTEWITIESGARVIDEAVEITATFIVDLEMSEVRAAQRLRGLPTFVGRGQERELPRRV